MDCGQVDAKCQPKVKARLH